METDISSQIRRGEEGGSGGGRDIISLVQWTYIHIFIPEGKSHVNAHCMPPTTPSSP